MIKRMNKKDIKKAKIEAEKRHISSQIKNHRNPRPLNLNTMASKSLNITSDFFYHMTKDEIKKIKLAKKQYYKVFKKLSPKVEAFLKILEEETRTCLLEAKQDIYRQVIRRIEVRNKKSYHFNDYFIPAISYSDLSNDEKIEKKKLKGIECEVLDIKQTNPDQQLMGEETKIISK